MTHPNLSRRKFLKTVGLTATNALALTLSGVSIGADTWSMSLKKLDLHTAESLSKLCRILYPHSNLGNLYYDACVEALDHQAAKDQELAKFLLNGMTELEQVFSIRFLELSHDQQHEAVKKIEGSAFFNKVRSHMVVALYDNPLVWHNFGYEGASYPQGGYLVRGFNDINWLPVN